MSEGPVLSCPGEANDFQGAFVSRVVEAFARVTGRSLIEEAGLDPAALGRSAWSGDFALLCHRGGPDAVLNYGNRFVLRLWDYDWDTFVTVPSRDTAPPAAAQARDDLMETVARDNFVRGYEGTRISRSGRLFVIRDVTVWRLLDEKGGAFGMAAFFRHALDLARDLEGGPPLG